MANTTASSFPRNSSLRNPKKIARVVCDRCGGSGFYHTYGECFRCGGSKVDPTIREWAFPAHWTEEECVRWNHDRLERNRKAREARHAERQIPEPVVTQPTEAELRAQMFAENAERCPKLVSVRKAMREHGVGSAPEFLWSICDQAAYVRLTDNQIEAFNRASVLYLVNYGD